MADKTRDRADKHTKKNMTPLVVTLCTLLVLAAVIAGFLYAGDIIGSSENSGKSGKDLQKETLAPELSVTDSEIIYGIDREENRIDTIVVCRLDSGKGELCLDLVEPEMSYLMSATLYNELSVLNIRIPQAGRFGGLLGYCSGSGAYDAGRKIASEVLAVDVKHYSCFDNEVLEKYIDVSGKEGERVLSLRVLPSQAGSGQFGTPGTMMGFVKEFFGEAFESDRGVDDRLAYLEAFDALGDEDVKTDTVPVIIHNEYLEPDASGWSRILRNK